MTKRNPFLDEAGEQVVHFMGDVRTLGKLGELRGKIVEMAESDAWRRYKTAVGIQEWRECEFDYFLISCDLGYDDVERAIKWYKLGEATRAKMDRNAGSDKRRTLEDAAAAYHAAGPETLIAKAERLGWISKDGKPRTPLSRRQQTKQARGEGWERQAQERRRQRITARRRRELDRLARETLAGLNEDEQRYLIDVLAQRTKPTTKKPSTSSINAKVLASTSKAAS